MGEEIRASIDRSRIIGLDLTLRRKQQLRGVGSR
jgi:hypothetical protein